MANYHVFASAVYTLSKPDHTAIQPRPPNFVTDTAITEAQLMEFVDNLKDQVVSIVAATEQGIFSELRTKLNALLHTGATPPQLSAGNPILDVYVGHSRPTGEAEVWVGGDLTAFFVHPVTLANIPPNGNVPIAVAKHGNIGWTSASVVAYKVP